MASFSGTSWAQSSKFVNLDCSGSKAALALPVHRYGKQVLMGRKINLFAGLMCSKKPASFRCGISTETHEDVKDVFEEIKSFEMTSQLIPKPAEVESLLNDICDTSIAEFKMNLGGFHLYVARDLNSKIVPTPPIIAAIETENKTAEVADANGSVPTQSVALSKPAPSSGSVQALLDRAADEGLVILKSQCVGSFQRSRTIKGKRAPPACNEKQVVKEGKVICFVEQLSTLLPVKTDVAGEVIKILKEDGEPVGYGDPLVAILPSFPGIKMLQ